MVAGSDVMGNDAPPDLLRARVGAPAGSICSARGRSTMNSYRYEIGLRMRHPSPDPAEIMHAPRPDPSRFWHAHEPTTVPSAVRPRPATRRTVIAAATALDNWR